MAGRTPIFIRGQLLRLHRTPVKVEDKVEWPSSANTSGYRWYGIRVSFLEGAGVIRSEENPMTLPEMRTYVCWRMMS